MDIKPSGYLPFVSRPGPDDKLIFSPAYIFPVEIFERGIMQRPRYLFQVVIVDGYDGRTTLLDKKTLIPDMEFVPGNAPCEYLDLKISPEIAPDVAEYGAVPADCRSWKKVVKNRRVAVGTKDMKLVWHVYAVRGSEVLDTFTGEIIRSAGLLGMLFS